MKKSFSISMLLVVAFSFIMVSCGGGIGSGMKGKSYKTSGWIDGDTFRISSMGAPTRTLTNVVQRKESSKRAAILNAQYQILEKFKGSEIKGAAGMKNFETTGMAVAQEVGGIVKGGSIAKVTWDADQNCEIIYEVQSKGLKKKVSGATWK
jgi:hypothetical protein